MSTALVHVPRVYWYRYHESLWSESKIILLLSKYELLKTTKAGVWLDDYGRKRFVLKSARKRFACPTTEEALASYHARKQRQARILRNQLAKAEAALTLQRDGDTVYFPIRSIHDLL